MKFSLLFPAIERLCSARVDCWKVTTIQPRALLYVTCILQALFLRSLVLGDEIQKSNIQWILVCLTAKNADTLAQRRIYLLTYFLNLAFWMFKIAEILSSTYKIEQFSRFLGQNTHF